MKKDTPKSVNVMRKSRLTFAGQVNLIALVWRKKTALITLALIISCSLFNSHTALSQTFYPVPDPSEYSQYGGVGSTNQSTCVRGTRNGLNGVTVGYFNGSTNFGNYNLSGTEIIKSSTGFNDIFILERHHDSGLNWLRTIGGVGDDQALSVCTNYSGSIVVGYFSGTVDFNPDPIATDFKSSIGGKDVFVLSLTPDGLFNWVYTMGSLGDDRANSIVRGADNVYITGTFDGTLNYPWWSGFTGLISSKGGTDAFVAKLSISTGAVDFVKSMGGPGDDTGKYIDLSFSGGDKLIYITGDFRGIADLDPTAGVFNLEADATDLTKVGIFYEKIDDDGNLLWANKIIGGAGYSKSVAVCSSSSGVYLVGSVTGLTDIDPGPGTHWVAPLGTSNAAGFLLKSDPMTGDLIWARSFISPLAVMPTDVFESWTDEVIVSGYFSSGVGLQKEIGGYELYSTPSKGSFIARYSSGGSLLNSRVIDNVFVFSLSEWEHACSNWLEFAGSFRPTTDFSDYPGMPLAASTIGFNDAFTCTWQGSNCLYGMSKNQDEAKLQIDSKAITVYPNPSQGTFTIEMYDEDVLNDYVLINVIGDVVVKGRFTGSAKINLEGYPSGVYLLQVNNNDGQIIERIVLK